MKFKKNNASEVIGILFTVMGLALIIGAVCSFITGISFNSKMPETTAIITDIVRHKKSHTVWIEYTVDGNTYEKSLGYYSSSMNIGDEVKIHYDPSNPSRFKKVGYIHNIIIIFFGDIFGGIGIWFAAKSIKDKKRKKFLIDNGTVVYATIKEVMKDRSTKVNGRHPYMIRCEVYDQYSQQILSYTSESCFNDLYSFIGADVKVYVDPASPSNAYVDIQSLVEGKI